MPPAPTDWLSAIFVLVSAAAIGAAIAWAGRRRDRAIAPVALPLELRELLAKRDALVDRLRTLGAPGPSNTSDPLARERHEIEITAALVQRAIEQEARKPPRMLPRNAGASAPRTGAAGFVWGVASAGVIAALCFFVRSASDPATVAREAAPALVGAGDAGTAAGHISGTIALDAPATAKVVYPAILFIYARPEGVIAGPPAAVLRLDVRSFPVAFSLGPEHSMMGGALPPTIRLEARIDSDGNVSTREPDAIRGFVDHLALGSAGVTVVVR